MSPESAAEVAPEAVPDDPKVALVPGPNGTVRPVKGLSGALTRFRIMAFVTGVLLAVMTFGLFYRYGVVGRENDPPTWYSIGWMLHGWFYVAYVAVGLDLVFRMRWNLFKALLILVAGTIPFMSFVAERWVTNRVKPLLPS